MNLIDGTAEDVRRFIMAVSGLAVRDFEQGGKEYGKTGAAIVAEVGASSYRIFHKKMASSIYNQTILTLKLMQDERGG